MGLKEKNPVSYHMLLANELRSWADERGLTPEHVTLLRERAALHERAAIKATAEHAFPSKSTEKSHD